MTFIQKNIFSSKVLAAFLLSLGTQAIADIPLMPGWPVTISSYFNSSATLADVDDDNELEVIAVAGDGAVYVWHLNGTLLPGWPQYIYGYFGTHNGAPGVGDIDGDSDKEIVVGGYWGCQYLDGCQGALYAFHHTGEIVSGWPFETDERFSVLWTAPSIIDLDGDSIGEVIVGGQNGQLHVLKGDGTAVSGWPKWPGSQIAGTPAFGDLDEDGYLEVIVNVEDYPKPKIYAYHHNGEMMEGWPVEISETFFVAFASPAIGDIDGDGHLEVVCGDIEDRMWAWNADGSLLAGWPVTTNGSVESGAALGDLDGDGDLEVVIGSFGGLGCVDGFGEVNVWHGDGTTAAGFPKRVAEWTDSAPALADVDGDGDIEVIIGSNCNGQLRAFHHDGEEVDGFPIDLGYIYTSPSIADLDLNGDLELAIPSGGAMYLYDLDGMAESIEWGNFQNDQWHSGQYGYSVIVSLEVIIDIAPRRDPNRLALEHGRPAVAILTEEAFDATQVDPETVRFGPAEAKSLGHRVLDVDNDRDADLVFYFLTEETGIACGDTEATLIGETFDGVPISGTDTIITPGCR